jgi:peptidoglycan/xylan/chitin deacetylase (PgdA/CDA1 family)
MRVKSNRVSELHRPAEDERGVAMSPSSQAAVLAPAESAATAHERRVRNDAFSFWQLPENWRGALAETIEESETAAEHYLLERYLGDTQRRPPSAMETYYRIKHLIPDRLRFRINSLAVRARRRKQFPNWPCESALMDLWREWLHRALSRVGVDDGWHIGFWPGGNRCCVVLTHDVESASGLALMERVAEIEEKHDFRSAWNLSLAQYEVDWERVSRMRARGFEFGAHGLSHDGRLFRSQADFAALAPKIEGLARIHKLAGFRAPSTLRRAEWIGAMAFDFDSSFADTDPWEPQPGGTCSLFPFHLGRLVELPYTLPQDHTLVHLLHRDPLQLWTVKARWIASLGGMILTLTHPDYLGAGQYLAAYEELLQRLGKIENVWRALPSQVAAWWRQRSALSLFVENGVARIEGPDTSNAVAVRLSEEPLAV